MKEQAQAVMLESAELKRTCAEVLAQPIAAVAEALVTMFRAGGTLLIFGNGGSAADAQHIAAEFINKYKVARPALRAIALTTDTSALTSISNDESYEDVFSRQVEGLTREGDVVLGITTSGKSENVIRALRTAQKLGAKTVAFSGAGGGPVVEVADLAVVVPHTETARIQEVHITAGHILCELVDAEMFGTPAVDIGMA